MANAANFTDERAKSYEPLSWLDGMPSRAEVPSTIPRIATLAVPAPVVPKAIRNTALYIALFNAFAGGFILRGALASPDSVLLWVCAAVNLLCMVMNIYRFHSMSK